jgi:hypothetical protein
MSANATAYAVTGYRWSSADEQDRFPVEDPATGAVITILGMQGREARELALAAEAVGFVVHPLAFGSPLADAAFAAHGPGSVRLPLAIVAGCYSLQRPGLPAVLECIAVLRGTRQTLPAGSVVLTSTAGDPDNLNAVTRPRMPASQRVPPARLLNESNSCPSAGSTS